MCIRDRNRPYHYEVYHYMNNPSDPYSISDNKISCIDEDQMCIRDSDSGQEPEFENQFGKSVYPGYELYVYV